jgi:hypothetical protein
MAAKSDVDLATAALEHLRAGEPLGDEFAVLAARIMSRLSDHPAFPAGVTGVDEMVEFVSEFVLDRWDSLAERLAADDPPPETAIAILVTYIERWLIDQWRKTDFGSVHHRLAQVLSQEPQYTQVDADRWWLDGLSPGTWDGNEAALLHAARGISAPPPTWNSDTRRPPLTDRSSLNAVLEAIFRAAGAPLPLSVLTQVCMLRFPHTRTPSTLTFEDRFDRPEENAEDPADEAARAQDAPQHAAEALAIVAELTDDERFILAHCDDLAAIQARLGIGKSQASQLRKNLTAHVRARVQQCDDPDAVQDQFLAVLAGLGWNR